nr:hypothetical protein CFP56_31732 [Quercus suber]
MPLVIDNTGSSCGQIGAVPISTSTLCGSRSHLPTEPHQPSGRRFPISPVSLRTSSPGRHRSVRDFVHAPHLPYGTSDMTPPVSATFDHGLRYNDDPDISTVYTRHTYSTDGAWQRRPSVETNISRSSSSRETSSVRRQSRSMADPYHIRDFAVSSDLSHTSSEDRTPPEYSNATYEPSHASLFMPASFEHHQAKARKRSNLPKKSTDIMKTWFDQVRSFHFFPKERLTC